MGIDQYNSSATKYRKSAQDGQSHRHCHISVHWLVVDDFVGLFLQQNTRL